MSCRRICRELVELFRFGELDRRSAPHLEHLANCRGCRDEVGVDRELVERLRFTLAQRVENAGPSGSAFAAILARAQSDEPRGWRRWVQLNPRLLADRLGAASAVAVVGLAVLLSASTQFDIVQDFADSSGERSFNEAPAARFAGLRSSRAAEAERTNGAAASASAFRPRLVISPIAEPGLEPRRHDPVEEPGETHIRVAPRTNYGLLGEVAPEAEGSPTDTSSDSPPPRPVVEPF